MDYSYQDKLVEQGAKILNELGIVYYDMMPRTGKTMTSFNTIKACGLKSVLFLTKKSAIEDIRKAFNDNTFPFSILVTNYENITKDYVQAQRYEKGTEDYNKWITKFKAVIQHYESVFDCVVCDEAHSVGAYSKPALVAKVLKQIVKDKKLILLSGTPCEESHSQLYHQFWISNHSPFNHKNFYMWSKEYVDIKQIKVNGMFVNQYDKAKNELILSVCDKYFVRCNQQDAGFIQSEIQEEIKYVDTNPKIKKLVELLIKNKYYQFADGSEIVCENAAILQQKIHQIYSGTIKVNDDYKILDRSKAEFIKKEYPFQRIVIFYKFIAEETLLKEVFEGQWTKETAAFQGGFKRVFLAQIRSGSMGVNLSSADYIMYYNIDFSATLYEQSRHRSQTLLRDRPSIAHWIFNRDGIENKIYKAVQKKRSYGVSLFRKDYQVN